MGVKCNFLKDLGIKISSDATTPATSWYVNREDNYLVGSSVKCKTFCERVSLHHIISVTGKGALEAGPREKRFSLQLS